MRDLSATELMDVWERGRDETPVARALLLLAAAEADVSFERLADLSIGRRDAQLIGLRARVFGRRIEALANCPQCGDPLELTVDTEDLRAVAPDAATGSAEAWRDLPARAVRVRPPTSADLLAVATAGSPEQAAAALLERCVYPLNGGDGATTAPADEIAAAITDADPLAELELALTCPACAHAWLAPFDIAAFFWEEVDVWARRTLREVHALAAAYGWTETEILGLTPRRRQAYLELLGA